METLSPQADPPSSEPIPAISLDQCVADLLNSWPEFISVFLHHGMACVGCPLAPFETLGEVLRIYQVDPRSFLWKLEDEIDKTEGMPREHNPHEMRNRSHEDCNGPP